MKTSLPSFITLGKEQIAFLLSTSRQLYNQHEKEINSLLNVN